MILVFHRTGERRYAVEAHRPGFPSVVMPTAPGYDPFIPHDMMHLVVEARLGLNGAVFGQLAAGGDAGTFHVPLDPDESSRTTGRTRKRVAKRGKRLLKQGRDECAQSERATFICWTEWCARSSSRDQNNQARAMAEQAKLVRDTARLKDQRALNQTKLDDICKHLDELSSHWNRLAVGQSMAVRWPDLAIVTELSPAPHKK